MRKYITIAVLALISSTQASQAGTTAFENTCARIAAGKGADTNRLHQLFTETWKWTETESPEDATYNGFPGVNDRWSDLSLTAIERRKHELEAPMKVLKTIRRTALSAADRLNYDLFKRKLEDQLEGRKFLDELLTTDQLDGPQQYIPDLLALMPAETPAQIHDILSRLEGIPTVIDQQIALLQEGLKRGITPPKITMRDVPDQVKAFFETDPAKSPLLVALQKSKDTAAREEATRLLKEKIIPAYKKFLEFLTTSYIPKCRDSIGFSALPSGSDWYAFRAKTSTTTSLTPLEIHSIGLSEVKRIRAEMDQVIAATGFKGSFEDFKKFLRTDSRFFYEKAEDLLIGYRDIAKRIDPMLIRLFGKLPRTPYGVKPVPSYAEKSQTTAYYEGGSPEAARPGYFFANTYDLKTRPKWEMEALTAHEAVPGHHLQISLAQETEKLPDFRRFAGYTAFVEGWGLYSESLGYDLGLYEDPYSKFGQLTYEMWRAIRLVVDTGMHALGWSRDQAIQFFRENASKTDHDIVVEIDRYIVWPGQALAYKIGQLKIKELREKARAELGDKFDIRAYHDAVLASGAVPMDVLETRIQEWVAERKKAKK